MSRHPSHSAVARILIVDDEPKLRDSIAQGLRLEPWDVVTASNGNEAMRIIAANQLDLVVLDWMLPDVDGMEILRRVRVHFPDLPVLIITARSGSDDVRTALEHGATDVIRKPFGFTDLLARCTALLESGKER